jgi:hypothetical protein
MVFSCRRLWASRSGATSGLAWFHSSTPELNMQPLDGPHGRRRQRSHYRVEIYIETYRAIRDSLRVLQGAMGP